MRFTSARLRRADTAAAAPPPPPQDSTWSTADTGDITATGGIVDGNAVEDWDSIDGSETFTQGTAGDRPILDLGDDAAGLTLIKFDNDDHLGYTPTNPVLAVAGTIYDYGSGSSRRVLARDCTETTDKPAFEIYIEEVSI